MNYVKIFRITPKIELSIFGVMRNILTVRKVSKPAKRTIKSYNRFTVSYLY